MAEKEYIERGALIAEIDRNEPSNWTDTEAEIQSILDYRLYKGIAISQPAADVVEVRHGEWKLMGTEMFMDGSYASKFCCSLCAREIGVCHEHDNDKYKYAKSLYPYCHCGAKMDGERKEQK